MESSALSQSHNVSTMPLPRAIKTVYGINGNLTDQSVLDQDVLDLQNWSRHNLKYIASIGGFLLIVLGTVGNGISMAVMRREGMKSAVAVVYLMALALTDTAFLWIGGGRWWIIQTFDLSLHDLHPAIHIVLVFLIRFLIMLSAWIIAFVSVQRMLVVLFPYKAKQIATRKKSWVSLLVLILTLVAYNIYSIHAVELRKETSLLMFLILPFSMIFIANVILIVKLIQSNVSRTLVMSEGQIRSRQAKRITITLISVSLIFLILIAPHFIMFELLPVPAPTVQDKKYDIIFKILIECDGFLITMNSAINFLLYCFTWPTFWTELCIMMCEWCSCFRTTHSVANQRGQHALTSPSTNTSTVSLNVLSS